MDPQLEGALIAAGAALFGAIIGGAVSYVTARAQIISARQHVMIEQKLSLERLLIQLLEKWMSTKADVEGEVTNNQIICRLVDMFISRVSLFMTIAHHFPRPLAEELSTLSAELQDFIYRDKNGLEVNSASRQIAIDKMKELDRKVPWIIQEKLRQIQDEISVLQVS